MIQQDKPTNMESAAGNPNSDEEDIEDEIRKLKQKVQEAIKKKEARKRREQKLAIRNELLKQLAELEADDTDSADSTINSQQLPGTASQLATPRRPVSIPQLEGTPQTGQIPVQRTVPQPQVPVPRVSEHGAHSGTQAERYQVPSEPQPGTSAMGQSTPHRQPTATVVRPPVEPWTQVIRLETSGKTIRVLNQTSFLI